MIMKMHVHIIAICNSAGTTRCMYRKESKGLNQTSYRLRLIVLIALLIGDADRRDLRPEAR